MFMIFVADFSYVYVYYRKKPQWLSLQCFSWEVSYGFVVGDMSVNSCTAAN